MVKVLILYFLNIKATHGYEIQKFIQLSGFDTWANIKAGSIYYALNKMEKDREIELVKEEIRGSRTRRIYRITDLGRKELEKNIEEELGKPLVPLNLDKFILPVTLGKVNKNKALKIIEKRIEEVSRALEYWKHWRSIKVGDERNEVNRISFDMTISNYEYELQWYKALIEEFDFYCEFGKKAEVMAKNINFEDVDSKEINKIDINKADIDQLKDAILKNPDIARDALEKLISMIGNKED